MNAKRFQTRSSLHGKYDPRSPIMYVPAADDEYPSVFLAWLMNRHRGVSGTDNFVADVGGGRGESAFGGISATSSVTFPATSPPAADSDTSLVESTISTEFDEGDG